MICFAFLIQILSLLSIYVLNSAFLIQASRQSTIDLTCISYARHMIENNNQVYRCHYDESRLITNMNCTIEDKQIEFMDYDTYILCSYDTYVLKVYYDEKGIVSIDFE